jgi:hypothetical protein
MQKPRKNRPHCHVPLTSVIHIYFFLNLDHVHDERESPGKTCHMVIKYPPDVEQLIIYRPS